MVRPRARLARVRREHARWGNVLNNNYDNRTVHHHIFSDEFQPDGGS